MYEPTRSLRSETREPLVKVPRTNLVTAGDQMVSTLGLLLRNTLTGNVRECSSQDGTTRTHLFTLSYGLEGFLSSLDQKLEDIILPLHVTRCSPKPLLLLLNILYVL